MPRISGARSKSAPKYRQHKRSGQAVVTINGKDHYLGKFDSEESHESYRRLIAEHWNRNGKPRPTATKPKAVTITTLAVEYFKHSQSYYRKNGKPTSELAAIRVVLRKLRSIYGSTPAEDFGPLKYLAFRQTFIDDGLTRTTINHYCWHVKRMFQHCGSMELVPMSLFRDLDAVPNLLAGRSAAKESPDVLPVDEGILEATLRELHPVLADMINLQLLSGMRPGEVRNLRPCDVDRSADVWTYRPPTHKNEHKAGRKAKIRIVHFGPSAQELLKPYLLRDHQAFCFSPLDVEPKRATQPLYSKDAYARAIKRAAIRAFPYPKAIEGDKSAEKQWRIKYCWAPNQLRHSAATLARKHKGIETAQQVCGHSRVTTTEAVYAEIDTTLAIEFARNFG